MTAAKKNIGLPHGPRSDPLRSYRKLYPSNLPQNLQRRGAKLSSDPLRAIPSGIRPVTMSTALLPRLALRQSRSILQRRCQSSTAESTKEAVSQKATQAKEGASQALSKAQQGLSRVTSSASSVASSAGQAVSGLGGRTGRLIGWVQGMFIIRIAFDKS